MSFLTNCTLKKIQVVHHLDEMTNNELQICYDFLAQKINGWQKSTLMHQND